MNFITSFAPDVLIRLTPGLSGFVCTVQGGLFHWRPEACTVELGPAESLESIESNVPAELVRVRYRTPESLM